MLHIYMEPEFGVNKEAAAHADGVGMINTLPLALFFSLTRSPTIWKEEAAFGEYRNEFDCLLSFASFCNFSIAESYTFTEMAQKSMIS